MLKNSQHVFMIFIIVYPLLLSLLFNKSVQQLSALAHVGVYASKIYGLGFKV